MKKAYEEKFQAKLDQWGAEIDALTAKADVAKADMKIEYQKKVAELKELQAKADKKLAEMRASGDDAWEDVKGGADLAGDSLKAALKSAVSRFK